MTESNERPRRRLLSARRLTLLGSVAVMGSAIAVAGPLGYGRSAEQAFAATPTSQAQQGPTGFADLVVKVKPAVISVRVKIDEGTDTNTLGPSSKNLPPSMEGTPFEKFVRQYGFGDLPDRELQRHEIITGVGSGFFISPDGYAVTNNHVVDHAKSVQVTTDDGSIYTAKVIGTDAKSDLALIKVRGQDGLFLCQFRKPGPAHRRLDCGGRQPLRPRRHGDSRHCICRGARHRLKSL